MSARDFLNKFWNVKILIPWTFGLLEGSKMVIFGPFLAKIAYLRPILASTHHYMNHFNYAIGIVT